MSPCEPSEDFCVNTLFCACCIYERKKYDILVAKKKRERKKERKTEGKKKKGKIRKERRKKERKKER